MPPRKPKYTPPPQPVGDLYPRPTPNPFTPEWIEGYDAAMDGRRQELGKGMNYLDGWNCGRETVIAEREEMDRLGSSNA